MKQRHLQEHFVQVASRPSCQLVAFKKWPQTCLSVCLSCELTGLSLFFKLYMTEILLAATPSMCVLL